MTYLLSIIPVPFGTWGLFDPIELGVQFAVTKRYV